MILITYQVAQSSCSVICDVHVPYSGLMGTLYRTSVDKLQARVSGAIMWQCTLQYKKECMWKLNPQLRAHVSCFAHHTV